MALPDCIQLAVQSYGGLLATRLLLGVAEAGIFPGSGSSGLKMALSYNNDLLQAST